MHWQHTPYTVPLLAAAALSIALVWYIWRRRSAPGAIPFMAIMLAVAVWSFGYALELASVDLPAKLFWARVQYLGIVSAPVASLGFALHYTNRTRWLTRRNFWLLILLPSLGLLLVWTNDWHHLIWADITLDTTGRFSVLILAHGAVFYAIVAYGYVLLMLASAMILQSLFRRPRLYRGQIIALFIAALAPWVGNALYVSGHSPFPDLDPTPLAFTLTCLAMAWGLFRFRLLDIVPVARDAVLDGMDDAVIVLDVQGRIVDLNPAAERLVTCRAGEAIGQPPAIAFAAWPALAQQSSQRVEGCAEITLGEAEAARALDFRGSRLRDARGSVIGWLIVLRDITARKRAEEAQKEIEKQREQARQVLRRRNRELALLNRVIGASAASRAIEPILATVCRELAEAFDLPRAAAALLNDDKTEMIVVAEYPAGGSSPVVGQAVAAGAVPVIAELSESMLPLLVEDARLDPRLGLVRDMLPTGAPLSLLLLPILIEGEMMGGLAMVALGTRVFLPEEVALARRVAEQVAGALARARLAETEQRLSTAVDQAGEAVMVTAVEGSILYVNPAFERIVGYSRAEVIGQPARILNSSRLDALFREEMWPAATSGQAWQERVDYTRRDVQVCHLDLTVAPVRDQAGEIVSYVTTMRDATREAQLEAEVQQAQKMEALGRLAGGVAHDFNNLLTIIKGSAQMLDLKLRPDDPLRQHTGSIHETVDRAARLTGQLVSFSRRKVIRPRVLSLNRVVRDLSNMLRRVITEDIQLVTALADDLWPIEADPTQIDQVITNLVVNARDAMPTGGTLTIETANVTFDDAYAEEHLEAQPGEYVRLRVSDTGVGMDDQVKVRIFEPFFTTKQEGQGSGLGLATVFGIVTQGRGRIEVHSEVDRGTTFTIYLPRAPETGSTAEALAHARHLIPGRLPRGTETVLVVEDDPAVRELMVHVLESCGYQVLPAAEGLEALQIGQQHDGPIHLLLSDVVLPYLKGGELAGRLLAARPEMRVLYVSGYTDGAIAQQGVLEPGTFFLAKPFSIQELARTVREILDDRH